MKRKHPYQTTEDYLWNDEEKALTPRDYLIMMVWLGFWAFLIFYPWP